MGIRSCFEKVLIKLLYCQKKFFSFYKYEAMFKVVKLKIANFWEKNPQIQLINYYKRMTEKHPLPILKNLHNFPPVAFYSTPTPQIT